jgi:CHASE3 domain sensor protein
MDYQVLFNIILGLAGALFGFILNAVWNSLKDLEKSDKDLADKVSKIEVLVAGQYVTREELERVMNTLFNKLERMLEKLDTKQDKTSS